MVKTVRNENMLTGNDPIKVILGAVMRRLRISKDLPMSVLAEETGTSQCFLSKMERGIMTLDTRHFWNLCDELCVSPSEVWKEVEELHAQMLNVDLRTDSFARYDLRLVHVARLLLGVKLAENERFSGISIKTYKVNTEEVWEVRVLNVS